MKKADVNKAHLLTFSDLDLAKVMEKLNTSKQGLTVEEVETRLKQYGPNQVARERPIPWYMLLLNNFKNPFIIVLLLLGIVSYISGDLHGTTVVVIMVILSVMMRFTQEYRSSKASEALKWMVRTKATVKRHYKIETEDDEPKSISTKNEVPFEDLVPGDIIYLSAGDMIPADLRLIRSKDLFISQSSLTGESIPIEKYDTLANVVEKKINLTENASSPLDRNNLCFLGTSVVSGTGKAIVISTGSHTYFGSLAKHTIGHRSMTSFDKGINSITWLLIKIILIMVPIIFIINVVMKGNWQDAFLFSIAIAVGLTPEMLPMIVTANLAKGALAMSKHKVIVKRLNAIQNFGAMDILCTDKTGTLTQDRIILEKYLDITGNDNMQVLEYGFLNSYYQSGLKNMLDRAILEHAHTDRQLKNHFDFQKIDEIPFDFVRRRMSVVLIKEAHEHILICKGAVEEILNICAHVQFANSISKLSNNIHQKALQLSKELNEDGFRVIAVGYKKLPNSPKAYAVVDEEELILVGLMAFLDPPKETAIEAIQDLHNNGVSVKILTGDNDVITQRICKEVNLSYENILLGHEIEAMTDTELSDVVLNTTIFAKLEPLQKSRIIKVLQDKGHTVGFLGDGINDAAALRDADVGISVDSAADIARESADIILLEKSLLSLGEGVIKGRQVYGNIIKYIKMTASSNFGNVFSVLIASAFIPFLPMLPLQILIQNLFYDISQLALPWDRMDKEFLEKPRKWDPKGIGRFMIYIGPISSIFDQTTFLLLWFIYGANSSAHQALFQTGWFVEGLLSQVLVVHFLRTRKIPFIQSMATMPLILMTISISAIGLYLPYSPIAQSIQLVHLPGSYFLWLIATLLAYGALVQVVKIWYTQQFKTWL